MSIVAALDKVLFFNASSKYSVLRMKTEDSSVPTEARSPYRYHDHLIRFTAVGIELPQTDTVKIEMDGEWKDGKYGLQLQVDHWQEIVPPTLEGVRNYLASGLLKGIGEKTADAIIEKFGINALEILEHQPDRLLEIRGITKERLAEIKDAYAETSRMRVLMTLLAPFKVTPTTAQKIYQHFGPVCADIVRQSPFNLCQVPGFGFKRIDAIVQKSGGDLRDPKRVLGALFYALEDARTKDGHLYLEAESLLKAAMQLLNERIPLPQMRVPMSQVEQELSAMIRQDEVVSNHGNVYLPKQFLQESETAQKAVELFLAKPTVVDITQPLERVKHSLGLNLSKRQSEGVEMVFRHNLSIITGGPGTGKTTVLKTVIEVYRQLYPRQKIVLGAPTGKASRRMAEATGIDEAQTLHSILKLHGDSESKKDRERKPLEAGLLIVDETSMVDMWLIHQLFSRLRPGTKVLLVGDADQLESVGAGDVFHELIGSGVVPVTVLDEIFRQAQDSLIAHNARFINEGKTTLYYTYDANGQVLTATDELGGVISYAYDANGRLIEMTDAMGGKTAYAYDAVGNVTSVTDALGGSTTYRYDETGNMTSVTDANGNTTGYSYDALGRAVAVTDANGGVTRAEYDHNGNIVKAVDAEGNATTYVYDALDRLASYTNAEGYTFSFQYDNEGNTVSSTDGNGNTTRYTYDGLNRAVSSTNAEGNTAYNTYDADGRMVKSVNEEGAETAYAYDADGRLISMTDALGNVTSFEYDSRDRVIKVTDAKGNATTFTYDLAGNVKSETNAKGVVTSYAYDANGNLTSMTDAAGTVTYTYDALNRVTSVKDRRGNTQFFTYDATDRIVQVKDRNGNATRYVYDGNGNIVKTIDALGTESVFTYNKNDQLISTDLHRVDALNGVDSHEITLYEYDGRNLVTKEINALGDSTVYVYDGNGNLVSKTDADGYVTRYSYTALDLVKKINYNGAKEVSYQYNKVGELVQMDDWTGTNTFELDLLGRLQKMTDHKGNTVSYTYDAVGNQTGITYPDGSKTRSFYDAVYNLTSVIDADDGTYAYVYDAANRPVKLTYPNGWIEQYTYDAEGNLLKTVDTDPFQLYNKTPKVKYEYTYDAEGNVLTEFQRDSDATENLKSRTAFTYDALNRLTGSTRRLEVYPYDTLAYAYTYDTLGNLLKQSGPTKGEEDTYQYNDLNQMVSKHVCGYEQKITRIYDYGYTYDKRGNLVKEEEICSPTTTGPENITIATYLYDETNRMVRGTNKAGEVSAYTFNGLGVRVGTELILEDNTHGYTDFHCQTPSVETGIEKPEVVKTDYVIDYTRLDIDQRVLMKSEQDGYDFFYTYGLDKLQVMTIGEGSNWWGQSIKKCVNMAYVHTDRLGSVVNLSDQYGRVTARADYTDWGEVRRYTDITVDGGFRRLLPEITYATHEYDDVLNQFYAKARMYDAVNKRFDAVDPILDASRYEIGLYVLNPMMLVQQVYAFDAPYTYIDPLGLMNYFTQTDDLLSGVWKGVKDNTIGLVESIPQAVPMVKELVKGVIGGDIDIAELAKAVLKGAVGDYWHVIRYADTLNPLKKKTDSEVYNYGRAVGSVATDIVLAFAGATIVDKAMDLLKGSKVGQKIVSLANQARNYFNDFTCQNKQVLANTLYDILDDSSDVAKAAAKRRIFSGGDAGEEFLKEMFGGRQQAYFKTSQGRRFVDQLAGRTAHESKVGYVAATDFIKKQAAKDAELLATKQVDEVVWHFFRSADTQKIGPSAPLKKLLEDYGIKVVIYE